MHGLRSEPSQIVHGVDDLTLGASFVLNVVYVIKISDEGTKASGDCDNFL